VFHYFYERQERGLLLSPFLRAFESNTVFSSLGNASDFSFERGLEQEHCKNSEYKNNGGPNESVRHIGIEMANAPMSGAEARSAEASAPLAG
jgi:hypothetical protein